jgi:putative tricarboxylic transport membrane protein
MKRRDLITSIVLLALAAAPLWEIAKLPIGSPSLPEAGFFPLILVILLGILSLVLLAQTLEGKGEQQAPPWVSSGGWKTLGLTVAGLFAFVIFFERIGYLISTFLLVTLPLWASGKMSRWKVILVAFVTAFASYMIFGILLQSPLPLGILQGVLGR